MPNSQTNKQVHGTTVERLHANDGHNDTWVNMAPPPIATIPSSHVATLHRLKLLHGSVVSTHIPTSDSRMISSQPNSGHVASGNCIDVGSSSQPVGGDITPDSPRRSRSQGSTSSYRLSYHRRGIEHSYAPPK